MEVLECIETRRSVRKYTDRAVEKALVEKLVRAAQNAPTWKNSQTTRFTAVLDSEKRWQVRAALPDFNQNSTQNAPVYLIVSAITHRSGYERDGSFSTPKEAGFEMFDAGIAAQTFCLAAWERGVGTVITGYFDEEKITRLLNLPENQKVGCVIGLGYPDEEPAAPKRKSVEDLLTYK